MPDILIEEIQWRENEDRQIQEQERRKAAKSDFLKFMSDATERPPTEEEITKGWESFNEMRGKNEPDRD